MLKSLQEFRDLEPFPVTYDNWGSMHWGRHRGLQKDFPRVLYRNPKREGS
jgi:hypothetical protein